MRHRQPSIPSICVGRLSGHGAREWHLRRRCGNASAALHGCQRCWCRPAPDHRDRKEQPVAHRATPAQGGDVQIVDPYDQPPENVARDNGVADAGRSECDGGAVVGERKHEILVQFLHVVGTLSQGMAEGTVGVTGQWHDRQVPVAPAARERRHSEPVVCGGRRR
jgi:hypothetical protein